MQGMGNNRQGVYDGKIAGLYDLEETLGSGHFAVVKLARHVFTGEKVAVKVIDKTKLDEVSKAHLFQEVRCMKLVQHPHVVRLYEVIDTQTKLYLILELGDGGDLYDYIMKHEGGLSENLAKEYFRQIVRAISYCHQLHVVHRDLKPENVVFFEKLGVVKLTDFGFSNKFCPGQKLETSCGSLAYSAPEILLGDSYDAPAVDVWSLGVILYMLVCGQPPFQEANDSETLTMIMDCKYDMPAHVSAGCRRLISTMLVREPEKRSTLQQIAQDVWLLEGAQDHGPEFLPLVSREQVSEDDHTLIIQKMVNGNIATNEEILEALDRNEYNHITATYFLLVERKLRAHRQEQAQRKRPDLTLPVSGASRISPRSRNIIVTKPPTQQQKDAAAANGDAEVSNTLLVPSSIHLNIPRTPGIDSGQTPRSRKCSIVQEEDDEEELSSCSGREELSTPLNRRGSRSEGRINIAIQDRIAESERLKKDPPIVIPVSKIVDGISGVTLITSDSNNTKERLGASGRGTNTNNTGHRQLGDFRPRTAEQLNKTFKLGKLSENPSDRSGSVDKGLKSIKDSEIVNTKILCDSSTISIPLSSNANQTNQITSNVPKYKTMPSPTRPNTILTGANCLNEIFEEGTDVGSSDSATTTPRPITRQNHFINNRTQSQGSMSSSSSSMTTAAMSASTTSANRRTKFHKTRTTSCSSSDASDDDSENRKKRAHKIVDVAKLPTQHRRDSHDDSSDSQDPGNNTTATGSTNNQTHIIHITSSSSTTTTTTTTTSSTSQSTTTHQESSSSSLSISSNQGGRPKNIQQQINSSSSSGTGGGSSGFRRHRAGRRRAGETRLRESQSLNRITEVQESEISITSIVQQPIVVQSPVTATVPLPIVAKPKGFSARLFHGFRKTEHSHTTTTISTANHSYTSVPQQPIHNQNSNQHNQHHHNSNNKQHNNNNNNNSSNNNNSNCVNDKSRIPLQTEPPDDDVEMVLSNELAKALRVSETKNTASNSTTKKLKILGKYFQVHKKLCIPIPGIFQRGRLYKAQSCGSIVRDKVVHTNPTPGSRNSTAGIASGGGGGSSTLNPHNSRHSALFSDKGRLLRNCLGATRLLGSDGDINQNNENKKHATTTAAQLFAISSVAATATKNCSLSKTTTSPIHHIGDSALCSSKC